MRKKIITTVAALLAFTGLSYADTSVTVNVTAQVGVGVSSLLVEPQTIAFGTVLPSAGNTRFASTTITANYFAANAGWRLEVSTDNALDANGLVATDGGAASMTMKVWTPDFGGGPSLPDPNDNNNFTGTNAVYKFVFDVDNVASPLNSTLAVDGINDDSAAVAVNLVIDAASTAVTTYTGVVSFDLVFP